MSLIDLVFWICTILLALGGVAGFSPTYRAAPWYGGVGLLVVIDLVILGLKVIGHS
jgi:hypothetical protein